MFLTDFRTQKYTGGIISRVGIFLTVTPVNFSHMFKRSDFWVFLGIDKVMEITNADLRDRMHR